MSDEADPAVVQALAEAAYKREFLAFDEKIALAKLEEAKAGERVRELEYQKARWLLDYMMASAKGGQA